MSDVTPAGRRLLDRLVVAMPLVLGPLLLFPRPAWLAALALPIGLGALRLWRLGRVLPSTPLALPLLLLAAAVCGSAIATPSLAHSAGKLGGIALGLLVFAGVLVFANTRGRLIAVVAGLMLCGAALAALSLVGTAWETKIEAMRPIVSLFPVRWKGLPGAEDGFDANPVGACMAMLVVLAFLMARESIAMPASRPRALRIAAMASTAALCVLFAGVLVLSQSRAAWLGGSLGAGAVWVAGRRTTRAWIGALSLVTVIVAIVGATIASDWRARAMPSTVVEALGVRGRGELWDRGLMVVRDFPLTGVGPNIFRHVVHVAYPPFEASPSVPVPHAHNGFLQTAIDIGLPGLTAYVAAWAAMLMLLAPIAHARGDRLLRHIAQGLLAGAVAIAVFQMGDAIPLGAKVGALWWVMAGLAAAGSRLRARAPGDEPHGRWQPGLAVWAAGSGAAVLVARWYPLAAVVLACVAGAVMAGILVRDSLRLPGGVTRE